MIKQHFNITLLQKVTQLNRPAPCDQVLHCHYPIPYYYSASTCIVCCNGEVNVDIFIMN